MAKGEIELANTVRFIELTYPADTQPLDAGLKNLLKQMLEKDPEKRISMEEVYVHDWVTMEGTEPLTDCPSDLPSSAPSLDRNQSHASESAYSMFSDSSFRTAASSPSRVNQMSFRSTVSSPSHGPLGRSVLGLPLGGIASMPPSGAAAAAGSGVGGNSRSVPSSRAQSPMSPKPSEHQLFDRADSVASMAHEAHRLSDGHRKGSQRLARLLLCRLLFCF
jgi:serine/threonine protein kinase